MFNFIKKAAIQKRVEDQILYEYVADELDAGVKIKGLWAKAYAQCAGDSGAVEPLYMQFRVQAIKDIFTAMQIAYDELSKDKIKTYVDQDDDNTDVQTEFAEKVEKVEKVEKQNLESNDNSDKGMILFLFIFGALLLFAFYKMITYEG